MVTYSYKMPYNINKLVWNGQLKLWKKYIFFIISRLNIINYNVIFHLQKVNFVEEYLIIKEITLFVWIDDCVFIFYFYLSSLYQVILWIVPEISHIILGIRITNYYLFNKHNNFTIIHIYIIIIHLPDIWIIKYNDKYGDYYI